jgi:alpha,alpha-trehalase
MWKRPVISLLILFTAASVVMVTLVASAQDHEMEKGFHVHVETAIHQLLEDEDVDNDKKITIDDQHIAGTLRGDKRHLVTDLHGHQHHIEGNYFLSTLLQELSLARDAGLDTAFIQLDRIYEPPVRRISRLIRELYWDSLTRRIDEAHLPGILQDDKMRTVDGSKYLYVPATDPEGFKYFSDVAQRKPGLNLKVVQLPDSVTPAFVRSLKGRHGLLTLALERAKDGTVQGVPFVVPGGRFNEMYGWDSYFEALGLLEDGRLDLAKAMVDNFVYEIVHYGKILNANRTYYLTRSQPPFLTSMIRAVYDRMPRTDVSFMWLKTALEAAVKEYKTVWMGADRLTQTGLSRYYDSGEGPPPEVEPGHFDAIFARIARARGLDPVQFEEQYRAGIINVPELDDYFKHDRAMRESGHDTSNRLEGICGDLVTVDLNSLLYKIETDIAEILEREFGGQAALGGTEERFEEWKLRAHVRAKRMTELMWNRERGKFFDYNFRTGSQHEFVSATSLYPLWAGLAEEYQARMLVDSTLPLLEMAGGLVSTTKESRGPVTDDRPARQWDYPNGWAPHQMLAWAGLNRYGYHHEAQRLAYRWLSMITRGAVDFHGTVPEKFDVDAMTHAVFAEYGNVGTIFSYITREGFGWMNASYQVGLAILDAAQRERLELLTPPDQLFP